MSEVTFLPAAEEEFFAASDRYEAEVPGLGADFIAEIERATERLAALLDHGSTYLAGTRRVFLRRFPFSLVDVHEEDRVNTVAVAHHRRRPGYWHDRL